MLEQQGNRCTAFVGEQRVAAGARDEVARRVKEFADRDRSTTILIFDDATGRPVEFDLRGTVDEVVARARSDVEAVREEGERRGPGRPKLGVVAREVTLLPRHWEWLGEQPGGASAALRRLVEEARRANRDKDRTRQAQEATYRFLAVMAGDRPGYEEAMRALFAGDGRRFVELAEAWPEDVRNHAAELAEAAFQGTGRSE